MAASACRCMTFAVVVVSQLFQVAMSTDFIGGIRAQPTMRTTTRAMSHHGIASSDDLIVSEVTTLCPFDDNVNVLDCSRHELPYTDALLLPVSKIVSISRNFGGRAKPTPSTFEPDVDASSGREPCIQDDEDCDMFSGDSDVRSPLTTARDHSSPGKHTGVFIQSSVSPQAQPTAVPTATWQQRTSKTTTTSATSPSNKKRRTTVPGANQTPPMMTSPLSLPATRSSAANASRSLSVIVTSPLISMTTVSMGTPALGQVTTRRPVIQQSTRSVAVNGPNVDSSGADRPGQPLIDTEPLVPGGVHSGIGVVDIARVNEIERLMRNVGLIIAVAICLAVLFLILAFVIYRYRGLVGSGQYALHLRHRHSQSGAAGGCKAPSGETKAAGVGTAGTNYVYETCNTLPAAAAVAAPTHTLVINRTASDAATSPSAAAATLSPRQQSTAERQHANIAGSRKEVKEWYV